eukprot:486005-Prorocentrum_minimum.AAC.1
MPVSLRTRLKVKNTRARDNSVDVKDDKVDVKGDIVDVKGDIVNVKGHSQRGEVRRIHTDGLLYLHLVRGPVVRREILVQPPAGELIQHLTVRQPVGQSTSGPVSQ